MAVQDDIRYDTIGLLIGLRGGSDVRISGVRFTLDRDSCPSRLTGHIRLDHGASPYAVLRRVSILSRQIVPRFGMTLVIASKSLGPANSRET